MKIIQSTSFKKHTNLISAFTTKDGGVSQLPYNSLNLAFHVLDIEEDVQKNHARLAKELGYDGIVVKYAEGTKEVVVFDKKNIELVKEPSAEKAKPSEKPLKRFGI